MGGLVIGRDNGRQPVWPLAVVLAIAVLATSWFYIRNVPLGEPPDEVAHLGYIADIARDHHVLPDYRHSVLLGTTQPNYLTHPPLYYTLEGLVGRAFGWSPDKGLQRYRTLSALLVAMGVFFWVLACGRFGFGALRTVAVVAACLAIPMFPYLAASVNNDNLCYLGVALFFYGLSLYVGRSSSGPYVIALGFAVVALTKATGALFLVAFLSGWFVLNRRDLPSMLADRHVRAAAVAVLVLCASYYVPTLLVYHTPFPAPEELTRDVLPVDPGMNPLRFAAVFCRKMLAELPLVISHRTTAPLSRSLVPWFYAMLASPLLAWALRRPFAKPGWQRDLGDTFLAALLVTVVVHFWFCWRGYLATGQLVGFQPRYYGFALPGLFVIGFLGEGMDRLRRGLLLAFAAIAVVLVARIPHGASIEHIYGQQRARYATVTMPAGARTPSVAVTVPLSGADAGYVDTIRVAGRKVTISGWAIDGSSKRPARSVWVTLDGRLLGTVRPTRSRPGVAAALGSEDALLSGFVIRIPGVPDGLAPCSLAIQAEQDDGSLAPLKNSPCQPPH